MSPAPAADLVGVNPYPTPVRRQTAVRVQVLDLTPLNARATDRFALRATRLLDCPVTCEIRPAWAICDTAGGFHLISAEGIGAYVRHAHHFPLYAKDVSERRLFHVALPTTIRVRRQRLQELAMEDVNLADFIRSGMPGLEERYNTLRRRLELAITDLDEHAAERQDIPELDAPAEG